VSAREGEISEDDPLGAKGVESSELANLGKIREILFGSQSRTTEQRLETLERRLVRAEAETGERLELIERKQSTLEDSIAVRLQSRRAETEAELGGLAAEVKRCAEQVQRGLKQSEQQVERLRQSSEQALITNLEALRDGLRQEQEDALRVIAAQVERLQANKVGRVVLGELLTNLAAQVTR